MRSFMESPYWFYWVERHLNRRAAKPKELVFGPRGPRGVMIFDIDFDVQIKSKAILRPIFSPNRGLIEV